MGYETDEEEMAAFNASFWRLPVGPPPVPAETVPAAPKELPPPPPAPAAAPKAEASADDASKQHQHTELQQQIKKLEKFLKPTSAEELPIDAIKARLAEFENDFAKRFGRRVTMADAPELPKPVLDLYDQLGRRLNPEERQKAEERLQAKKDAAQEETREAAAAAAAEADRKAAAATAREQEWADFELNQESVWKAAASEAKEQREAVAHENGLSSGRLLSGAATWKYEEVFKPEMNPTKEQYIEEARLARGLTARPGMQTEEEMEAEEAEWAAKGGDEADRVEREAAAPTAAGPAPAPTAASDGSTAGASPPPSPPTAELVKPVVKVLGPCAKPNGQQPRAFAVAKGANALVKPTMAPKPVVNESSQLSIARRLPAVVVTAMPKVKVGA